MPLLYDTFKPIIGVALRWYYRSLTTANLERIPRDGPVFLAANHPNSLTDAMVVGWASPRRVRFTAKATLFTNPLSARFLRAVGVVPLRRAADEASGPERAGPERAGQELVGDGSAAAVATSPSADAARNAASFTAVADAMLEGSCVVVFPEGKTTDNPFLSPIRTGLARMALMARDERGVRGIRIVPIGLLFERKEEPRTRILLQVGDPIAIDDLATTPNMVASLTDLIEQRLRAVTLNFENADDAERIGLVSETLLALVEPTTSVKEGAPSLALTMSLVRRITRAQQTLRARHDPVLIARADDFEHRLRTFRVQLQHEGIDVHDIGIDCSVAPGARFAVRELALAAIMLPISAWGRLTHGLPLRLARALALRNVTARDEPPMRTFIFGLVLVLSAYVALTTAVALVVGPWWALVFLATLIPSASSDLRYSDRMKRSRARARAYGRVRRDLSLQQRLLAEADWLRSEAGALERLVTAA